MRILILKPSSLGDVIQALPVLRLLKRRLPESEIYWWIDSRLAPLLEGDPDLTGVLLFNRQRWAAPGNWLALAKSVAWARKQSFDWVIDLQNLARSAVFAWLANGRLTVGLDDPREGAPAFYDLAAPQPAFSIHAVDWHLAVLPLLGVPVHWDFEWMPPRKEIAAALRSKWPVAGARWLLLQPGARWLNKRWPVEYFGQIAKRLQGLGSDFRVAILGSNEDAELGKAICAAAPGFCLDLTGRLSLLEMVEWIRLGELMITNDTGPMHVAAALGKPLVPLFGPTDPLHSGPYGQLEHALQLDLPCVPCQKASCSYHKPFECLRALSLDVVFAAVQKRARLK